MNTVRNYQKELDKLIAKLSTQQSVHQAEGTDVQRPRLLLHACCAPCSSYCLEYLRDYFDLTVFYYNPNITEDVEYRKRVEEERRLIGMLNTQMDDLTEPHAEIKIIEGDYDPASFYEITKGLESCPEGGERCFRCYELRLRASARAAKELQSQSAYKLLARIIGGHKLLYAPVGATTGYPPAVAYKHRAVSLVGKAAHIACAGYVYFLNLR